MCTPGIVAARCRELDGRCSIAALPIGNEGPAKAFLIGSLILPVLAAVVPLALLAAGTAALIARRSRLE